MNRLKTVNTPIYGHYGWLIVTTAMLCNFSALGLGRLALGMLLPSMGISLNLSYAEMGLISTFNFIGYLVSVLSSGWLMERYSARHLVVIGTIMVGITMFLIGQATSYFWILLLYFLTGIGSGGSTIPLMTIVTIWFTKERRGRATGYVVAGTGLAILLSGKLIPYLNELWDEEGWRLNWMVLSGIVLTVALLSSFILRNKPEDIGLLPVGNASKQVPGTIAEEVGFSYTKKDVVFIGALFAVFGFTYVIYSTFLVTSLVQEHGYSEENAGNLWSVIGFLSIFSGPIFGSISDRWGRSNALVMIYSIQSVAYFLAATLLPGIFLYISVCLFGLVAWSIPSVIVALVADKVGSSNTARILGYITIASAGAQIIGPLIAGIVAEQTGSFAASFFIAGVVTIIGTYLSFKSRKKS